MPENAPAYKVVKTKSEKVKKPKVIKEDCRGGDDCGRPLRAACTGNCIDTCTGYHKHDDYTEWPVHKRDRKCESGFNARRKSVNPQEWHIIKTRIAIDQISTPTFRFLVPKPGLYNEGKQLVVTMRQNERAVQMVKPGQTLYVYDRKHLHVLPDISPKIEVQIEVLPAGVPASQHPVPPMKLGWGDRLRSGIMHGGKIEDQHVKPCRPCHENPWTD